MTTLGSLIDQTLNEILIGTYRSHQNQLANPMGLPDTTLTTEHPIDAIGEGTILEIDQEMMYVVPGGVNPQARTMAIIRGVRGSVAATHNAAAVMSINPRFPRHSILNSMREEVLSWPTGIYRTESSSFTMGHGSSSMPLQGEVSNNLILHVLNLWVVKTGTDAGRLVRQSGWRYEQALGTLYLRRPSFQYADEFQILVGTKIDPDDSPWTETLDPGNMGIMPSMQDILKYGAAWRLIQGREAKRLFTETEVETARAQEVPVQSNTQLGRSMKQLRDMRVGEEIFRLRSLNGMRAS